VSRSIWRVVRRRLYLLKAKATAAGIDAVAASIKAGAESAQGAVSLSVAEKYVEAFGKLAKEGTAVVVPGNVGDIGSMIASAMAVYGKVGDAQAKTMAAKALQTQNAAEESDEGYISEKESPNDEMKRSMLASFENTRSKK
jgi:hypothetical protein